MSTAQAWVSSRASVWSAMSRWVATLRQRGTVSVEDALHTVENYRSLARDLASARRLLPGTRVTAQLEALYAQLHGLIRRKPHGGRAAWAALFRTDVPGAFHSIRGRIGWITTLFVASAAAGWWLVGAFPELVSLFASEGMIRTVEGGRLWTDDILNVTPSSLLSIRILSNNIAVSIFAICLGFFFGIGTVYIIATNGLMLGGVFAFTHQHDLADRLFEFVVAHGMVELSVICIAGAIGVTIGESVIRPTRPTRRESFQHCMQQMGPLILMCALLLVGAGLIEGFISPNPTYPLFSRVVIGAFYWLLMVVLLTGAAYRR